MNGQGRSYARLPRLYAVTDESLTPDATLVAQVRTVLAAGVKLVQVRFKTSPPERRLELGRELRALTSEHGALLVVNDHPSLARKIGADGVHLGESDPDVETARRMLGPEALVGVSVYDRMDRVRGFAGAGVDYFGASSPYASPLKRSKAVPGMSDFAELVGACAVPVYGIGGITPARVEEMIGAGCHGVAAVTAIFGAADPAAVVEQFIRELGES